MQCISSGSCNEAVAIVVQSRYTTCVYFEESMRYRVNVMKWCVGGGCDVDGCYSFVRLVALLFGLTVSE